MNKDYKPIQNKTHKEIPKEVIEKLEKRKGRFTDMKAVFYCIKLDKNHWTGVAGDGDNGSYEWFSLKDGILSCSDQGWGCTTNALKKALNEWEW